MMLSEDLARRASKVVLFEDAARDVDGRQVKMYSIVTPVNVVVQHFEEGQPPIEARPGDRLVVLGAADGDTNHLWLEIDEKNQAKEEILNDKKVIDEQVAEIEKSRDEGKFAKAVSFFIFLFPV